VAICYSAGARRPTPHSAQRPSTTYRKALAPPLKSGNSSPFTDGRKEAIGTTRTNLQGVTYPAHTSMRNTAVAPGGKKFKTPTTGSQAIKTITKNNSRCINLNAE
jgi:hypothetical protein